MTKNPDWVGRITGIALAVRGPLGEPVRISGTPIVNLVASTSGTDSDWVVKLIDVYPDEVPSQPEMGGYELARHALATSAPRSDGAP